MTTITITFENELESLLDDLVQESGLSPEEAMKDLLRKNDALRRWRDLKEDELLQGWTWEELRAEVSKGLESGEPTPWDVDAFLKEAHARFERRSAEES